jgi:hypothetical protein
MPAHVHGDNGTIAAGIIAVARAQARMPGFDFAAAKEAAAQIDRALENVRTLEATFAVCIVLLKGIGLTGADDESRYR